MKDVHIPQYFSEEQSLTGIFEKRNGKVEKKRMEKRLTETT
jgi:hypothetical protein